MGTSAYGYYFKTRKEFKSFIEIDNFYYLFGENYFNDNFIRNIGLEESEE